MSFFANGIEIKSKKDLRRAVAVLFPKLKKGAKNAKG